MIFSPMLFSIFLICSPFYLRLSLIFIVPLNYPHEYRARSYVRVTFSMNTIFPFAQRKEDETRLKLDVVEIELDAIEFTLKGKG